MLLFENIHKHNSSIRGIKNYYVLYSSDNILKGIILEVDLTLIESIEVIKNFSYDFNRERSIKYISLGMGVGKIVSTLEVYNEWIVSSSNDSSIYDSSLALSVDRINFFYRSHYPQLIGYQKLMFLRGLKNSLIEIEMGILPSLLKKTPVKELIRYKYCNK